MGLMGGHCTLLMGVMGDVMGATDRVLDVPFVGTGTAGGGAVYESAMCVIAKLCPSIFQRQIAL